MSEAQLYREASEIIAIAMGRDKSSLGRGRKAKTVFRADEDPLAHWCGVEAIVSLVQRTTLKEKTKASSLARSLTTEISDAQ